jgi:hypothetical protein
VGGAGGSQPAPAETVGDPDWLVVA